MSFGDRLSDKFAANEQASSQQRQRTDESREPPFSVLMASAPTLNETMSAPGPLNPLGVPVISAERSKTDELLQFLPLTLGQHSYLWHLPQITHHLNGSNAVTFAPDLRSDSPSRNHLLNIRGSNIVIQNNIDNESNEQSGDDSGRMESMNTYNDNVIESDVSPFSKLIHRLRLIVSSARPRKKII